MLEKTSTITGIEIVDILPDTILIDKVSQDYLARVIDARAGNGAVKTAASKRRR
jgi:hypothetical protein